jgi:hypothetical protein
MKMLSPLFSVRRNFYLAFSTLPLATANRAALAAALGVQGLKAPLARSPSAARLEAVP